MATVRLQGGTGTFWLGKFCGGLGKCFNKRAMEHRRSSFWAISGEPILTLRSSGSPKPRPASTVGAMSEKRSTVHQVPTPDSAAHFFFCRTNWLRPRPASRGELRKIVSAPGLKTSSEVRTGYANFLRSTDNLRPPGTPLPIDRRPPTSTHPSSFPPNRAPHFGRRVFAAYPPSPRYPTGVAARLGFASLARSGALAVRKLESPAPQCFAP